MNLPVFQDILKSQKNLSKTTQDFIIKNHNLNKIKKKIESIDINPEKFELMLEKYRNKSLMKTEAANVNTTRILTTKDSNSCTCNGCEELSKTVHIPRELMKSFERNDLFTNIFKECSQLLSNLNKEISVLNEKHQKTNCEQAKQKYKILMLQEIIKSLNEQNFCIEKTQTNFQIITYSMDTTDFYVEISNDTISIKTSRQLILSPLEIRQIFPCLIIKSKESFSIEECEDLLFMPSAGHMSPYLNFSSGNILNNNDIQIKLSVGHTLFSIKFESKNNVFVRLPPSVLQKNFDLEEVNCLLTTQSNLTSLVNKCLERNLDASLDKLDGFSLNKAEKQEKISYLAQKANIGPEMFKEKNTQKLKCHFAQHKDILNKILLGNQLSKSNGIFSKDFMISAQNEDYKEIFQKLKNQPEKSCFKDFTLKAGVLYKKNILLGKDHLRLCLPSTLCREILFRIHNIYDFHLSKDKMIKLFNLNFYCTNVNQLVSSITNNCLVCSLYKSPHKRRISGDERSHQEMKPGKNLSMDICYMNRSARNHKYLLVLTDILTGYVVSYPMTKLDSEETSKKLVQYMSHFPVPSTILCDGAHEFSRNFLQMPNNDTDTCTEKVTSSGLSRESYKRL